MMLEYVTRLALSLGRGALKVDSGWLDEVRFSMRVWPTDLDPYLHMNNGRYLTILDFARSNHLLRTGLGGALLKRKLWMVAAGATIQFRRELKLFERYDAYTRLAYWDERFFYMEQRLRRGERLHTWATIRIAARRAGKTVPPAEVWAELGLDAERPEPSPELAAWLTSLESDGLRDEAR